MGLASIGRSDTAVQNPRAACDPRDCPLTPGDKASRSHQPCRCCCQDHKPERLPSWKVPPRPHSTLQSGGACYKTEAASWLSEVQKKRKTLTMAEARMLAGGQDPAPTQCQAHKGTQEILGGSGGGRVEVPEGSPLAALPTCGVTWGLPLGLSFCLFKVRRWASGPQSVFWL